MVPDDRAGVVITILTLMHLPFGSPETEIEQTAAAVTAGLRTGGLLRGRERPPPKQLEPYPSPR